MSFRCDSCSIVFGRDSVRFKCMGCSDYDLCDECYNENCHGVDANGKSILAHIVQHKFAKLGGSVQAASFRSPLPSMAEFMVEHIFPPGTGVVFHSLKRNPELNDTEGVVKSHRIESGDVTYEVEANDRVFNVAARFVSKLRGRPALHPVGTLRVGDSVVVPREIYPTYSCTELDGAGWEATVSSVSYDMAVVHYTHACTADGRRYADEPLSFSVLRVLKNRRAPVAATQSEFKPGLNRSTSSEEHAAAVAKQAELKNATVAKHAEKEAAAMRREEEVIARRQAEEEEAAKRRLEDELGAAPTVKEEDVADLDANLRGFRLDGEAVQKRKRIVDISEDSRPSVGEEPSPPTTDSPTAPPVHEQTSADELKKFREQVLPTIKKKALVVGVKEYDRAALRYSVNDATDVHAALRRMNFDAKLVTDPDIHEFDRAIKEFNSSLSEGDIALFYFAGHGVEAAVQQGRHKETSNWLLARKVPEANDQLKRYAVDARAQLADMLSKRPRLTVMILDCCRNNPLPDVTTSRSLGSKGGLEEMQIPDVATSAWLAYACKPKLVAAEPNVSLGYRNGYYTRQLLSMLEIPGLRIEDLFCYVKRGVIADTEKVKMPDGMAQIPWDTSSMLEALCLI